MPIRFPMLVTRRSLLTVGSAAVASSLSAMELTVAKNRHRWRFCNKCQVMFHVEGTANKCAAGASHVPQGYDFYLPVDVPGTPTMQNNWRQCRYCHAMVYNGYAQKGRCPATGRGHQPDTDLNYVLPHDVRGTPKAQNQWRFCNKCFAMFYNGYPAKGVCPAGAAHVAQGYDFVLPHDL
jgi:hypothetical protein